MKPPSDFVMKINLTKENRFDMTRRRPSLVFPILPHSRQKLNTGGKVQSLTLWKLHNIRENPAYGVFIH